VRSRSLEVLKRKVSKIQTKPMPLGIMINQFPKASTVILMAARLSVIGLIAYSQAGLAQTFKEPSMPEWQSKFLSYINGKYRLYIGEDRSSCAHDIDPSDIHSEGNTRFVTARVGRSAGTMCRGILEFAFFQADCQTRKFYRIIREAEGDERLRGWNRYETDLTDGSKYSSSGTFSQITSQQLADKVCNLPVKRTGNSRLNK